MSTAARANPFPGLRPFREDEEHLFFGRENQVDAMVDKLASTHFLAVVGTSGSGKSSLVNCGLRPALHGGLMASAGTTWRMAQFRPGSDPMRMMASALAEDGVLFRDFQAGGLTLPEIVETNLRMSKLGLIDIFEQAQLDDGVNLLVVVDQFEELFRYRQFSDIGAEATAFVNLLLEAGKQTTLPIYVVLTMRSDFLGDCAQFGGLAEAINRGQYLVPRMTRHERRAAILGPVGVGGAEIAPVLLTRLVNDVGDNPDQLSILQHALNRTWAYWQNEGRGEGPLGLTHYEAIGSMAHALDQHAEKAFAELATARQKQICERLFKALTDKATDPRGIRRPTNLGTLCALTDATEAEVTAVMEVFRRPSRSFMMPPAGHALDADTVVDISHESLMRVWKRLDAWADEEALSAQRFCRLADTAVLHEEGKAGLWHDPDLQLALDWRERVQPNETWAARYHPAFAATTRFLEKSKSARTRRRATVIGIAAFVFLALGAGLLFALNEKSKAEAHERVALEHERLANSGRLAAASVLSKNYWPHLASLLAMEALDAEDTFDARNALLLALQSHPRVKTCLRHRALVHSVAFARGGMTLASGTEDNRVVIWTRTDEGWTWGRALEGHEGRVKAVAFSPDGKTLASGSVDETVRLWKFENARWATLPLKTHEDEGHESGVNNWVRTVAFAPDGMTLASGSNDGTVRFWKFENARWTPLGRPLKRHDRPVNSVAFASDGKTLASGSHDGAVQFWEFEGALWEPGQRIEGNSGPMYSVAFAPDGRTLAAGGQEVRLMTRKDSGWQLLEDRLSGHVGRVLSVAFAPGDGGTLASGGDDKTVRLWTRTGSDWKPDVLTGHNEHVKSVAFAPDGKTLASASDDRTVRLWTRTDSAWSGIGKALQGVKGPVESVAFADGKTLASANGTEGVRLLMLPGSRREPVGQPEDREDRARSVAFAPDGMTLASGTVDGTLQFWKFENERWTPRSPPLKGHATAVSSVAFAPGGKTLASGSDDGTVRLWTFADSRWTLRPKPLVGKGRDGQVYGVAFAVDGKTLAAGCENGSVRLWTFANSQWEPLDGLEAPEDPIVYSVAFAADGETLAAGCLDGNVRLWTRTDSGWEPLSLEGQREKVPVYTVVFAPDGTTLAAGYGDGTVRLWTLARSRWAQLGGPLKSHAGAVLSLAFAPDGDTLAAGCETKLFLWEFEVDSWRLAARRRGAHVGLSEDERQKYNVEQDDHAR